MCSLPRGCTPIGQRGVAIEFGLCAFNGTRLAILQGLPPVGGSLLTEQR